MPTTITTVGPAVKKVKSCQKLTSDGLSADYYEMPSTPPKQLQDLISYKNMNAQIGEIFRSCYRYGEVSHSEKIRDAKKMRFYAEAEIKRLEHYESQPSDPR